MNNRIIRNRNQVTSPPEPEPIKLDPNDIGPCDSCGGLGYFIYHIDCREGCGWCNGTGNKDEKLYTEDELYDLLDEEYFLEATAYSC